MKTFTYTITDEIGIHARPAGMLAKLAKSCASKVTITANGKTAEATKLMAVMGLGAQKGTEVIMQAEGADEEEAIVKVEEFMKANL